MISEVAQEPDPPIAPAESPPGSIFDDAYWDYGLILAWIIYRDSTLAESFSEQAPRALGNVLIETVKGAKAAKKSF